MYSTGGQFHKKTVFVVELFFKKLCALRKHTLLVQKSEVPTAQYCKLGRPWGGGGSPALCQWFVTVALWGVLLDNAVAGVGWCWSPSGGFIF